MRSRSRIDNGSHPTNIPPATAFLGIKHVRKDHAYEAERAPASALFFVGTLRKASGLECRPPLTMRWLDVPTGPNPARPGCWMRSSARAPSSACRRITRSASSPASDTGAVEMAMWSLLGQRGLDILAWESFGEGWVTDVVKQLKLKDVRRFRPDYGALPDLSAVDSAATWSSPGTARPRACACRTATGSRTTARVSRSATPPRRPSPWTCPGPSSMS